MSDESQPLPSGAAIRARYFDGRQALAREVSLSIANERVLVRGSDVARDEALASVSISERIGRTPRFVRFHDQSYCEVLDHDALDRALAAAGIQQASLSRWEQSTRIALSLVVVLVLIVVVGYRYGLPVAAKITAKRLPPVVLNTVSRQTLQLMDRALFEPSTLPEARQREIQTKFQALRHPSSPIRLIVTFRSSDALGANAMALPNGTIVVTDALAQLASNDDEIVAVLAHEAGHVEERHGLRNVIQSSVVSVFVSWYLGDVNAIIAAAPAVLMQAKYSRDLEREADDYAAIFLAANGLSASLLGEMLEKLERERTGDTKDEDANTSYLSSHPATRERIERLKAAEPARDR